MAAPAASPAVAAPVTRTIATYADGAQIAARGSMVVVARRNAAGQDATLLTSTGGAPVPAPGAGVLPVWAQPSVGTDRDGRRVVVYPRCSTSQISSCDLYSYTTSTGRERRIAGVNRATVGEVDGSMERGAVAFNRWTSTSVPSTVDTLPASERTRLFHKAPGGVAQLVTERGGRQLALRDRWIAQVRDTDPSATECGRPTVEVVSVGGQRRTARASGCGLIARLPSLPTFVEGDLRWGESWSEPPSRLQRFRLSDGRLRHTEVPTVPFRVFAHTSTSRGYALAVRYRPEAVPPGGGAVPFVFDLLSVTSL